MNSPALSYDRDLCKAYEHVMKALCRYALYMLYIVDGLFFPFKIWSPACQRPNSSRKSQKRLFLGCSDKLPEVKQLGFYILKILHMSYYRHCNILPVVLDYTFILPNQSLRIEAVSRVFP